MPTNPFLLPYGSGFLPTDFSAIGLAAPATLFKVVGTLTTLTVGWSAVTGASSYLAQITDFSSGVVYQTHITTLLECTFDNLDPTILYFVTVAATAPGSFSISDSFNSIMEIAETGAFLLIIGNASIIVPLSALVAQGVLAIVGNAVIAINPLQAQGVLHITGAAQIHQAGGLSAQGSLHVNGTGEFL